MMVNDYIQTYVYIYPNLQMPSLTSYPFSAKFNFVFPLNAKFYLGA